MSESEGTAVVAKDALADGTVLPPPVEGTPAPEQAVSKAESTAESKAESKAESTADGDPPDSSRESLPEIEPGPREPPPVPPKRKASEHPGPMSVTPAAPRAWPPTVVGDIMTRKVIAIKEHEPIGDLGKTMERFHFHHLPVVTPDMVLVGLITRSDYLHAMLGHPIEGSAAPTIDAQTPASAIMRRNVVTGTPDAPLATACRVMVTEELSCFPIIQEDGTLVGIVTQADFVKLVLEFLEL